MGESMDSGYGRSQGLPLTALAEKSAGACCWSAAPERVLEKLPVKGLPWWQSPREGGLVRPIMEEL